MKIRGTEEATNEIEVECLNCDYTRVITLPRHQLFVRTECPQCKRSALTKKGKVTVRQPNDQ